MIEYRNKKSGAVVLLHAEIESEEWEKIPAPLSSDSESEKMEDKPKRKTASKKKK